MKLLLSTTWKYIRRNPGLSIATVVIITITFSMGTLLFLLNLLARETVTYLQTQPTISVFYDPREKEDNVLAFKSFLEKQPGMIKVSYNTSAEIQKNYLSSIGIAEDNQDQYAFDTNPIKIIRLHLEPNADYDKFVQLVNEEKSKGALIMDIVFFKEIVDKIKEFSNTIALGGSIVTGFLLIISLVLIYLTIGFTINRFAQEIDIMQLVGAEPKLILMPFTLQGAFYGTIAALISYISMLLLWFGANLALKDNILFTFFKNIISEVGLGGLYTLSPFYLLFGLILIILGFLVGFACSYLATRRYIRL